MKIRSVGAELFHADGRTDGRTEGHDDATRRFCNFVNAPKKLSSCDTDSIMSLRYKH
jgi:hypothetical protein